MRPLTWRLSGAAIACTIFAMLFGTLSLTMPVSAQLEPTATPTDPIWLGLSASRELIEETEGVDLTIVQRWDFWQDDWTSPNAEHPQQIRGIESCVSDVVIVNASETYFGWSFQIQALNGNSYETRVSFDLEEVVLCDISSSPVAPAAPSGDSGGEPASDLDAPVVAGSAASGSFELGGHVDGLGQNAINAMNRAGMTWVKKQLRTSSGVNAGYNMINDAHSKGYKILLGVVGDKNALAADPDGYGEEFATFVRALAEAGADAIEVWNEPNIDREWPTGQINGANYTRLLSKAYNAIKGVNGNTIVISGAPAPTGYAGAAGCIETLCNDDVFMAQMRDAGAANYMDCVGLHYNEGIVPPTANSGDPRGEYPTYYFQSMTNRGDIFGKPICYTELGYLSGEGMGATIPGAFAWAGDTSLSEHATWLAGAAAAAAQRGDVRLMIIWNVNFTRWDTDPMGGYAMLRPDGSCPACDTLGTAMGG